MRALRKIRLLGRDEGPLATHGPDVVRDFCELLNQVRWKIVALLSLSSIGFLGLARRLSASGASYLHS